MLELLLELLWEIVGQIVFELVFEVLSALARAVLEGLFEGRGGRLNELPVRRLAWHLLGGMFAGAVSVTLHPAPVLALSWIRAAALLSTPLASGVALAAWDVRGGRTGDGRGRAGFWAGVTFGLGYVLIRVGVGRLLR